MELKGAILPGYKIYDYIIVLNPHEDLRNKILEIRKSFNSEYKITTPLPPKPNLHLVSFSQYEMIEERIKNRLNKIALGQPPFKVDLKDFGSFPAHTIYISAVSKLLIQALVKSIRTETQALMKLNEENKPYFNLEPHITIASKLKPWQYEKGWLEYSNKHFTGRFIADGMLLLKREQGGRSWQILRRFEFQNLPVSTKQGELFG